MRSSFLLFAQLPVSLAISWANAGEAVDLAGAWMSNYGPVSLRQDGPLVTGSFTEGTERVRDMYAQGKDVPAEKWNANPGAISDGSIEAATKTLTFKYHEEQSQLDGVARLTLSADGNILEGPYEASGMGGHLKGTWTMWRNRCGSAKYLQPC